MLRLEKVSKSFGNIKVLKNINLDIKVGERVVIIGPSGSGKSTLLRCINFLSKPDKGNIYFEDVKLDNKNIEQYRQKIGMVFQSFNLFDNLTVMDNLILVPVKLGLYSDKEARKKAQVYLKRINLSDKENVFPKSLSGGQKQRVAIIRTLMMNPSIILFDEPTSALDPEMVNEVQELMLELALNGMTMMIVTHEVSFIEKVATRMVFINEGRVIFDGSYSDMLKSDNKIVKLFLSNIK